MLKDNNVLSFVSVIIKEPEVKDTGCAKSGDKGWESYGYR